MRATRIPALVAALAVVACNGDGGPTGTDATPDVRGTYEATHTFTVILGGLESNAICTGTVQISRSSDGEIAGTVTIAPCEIPGATEPLALTTPMSGTITMLGQISFTLLGQEGIVSGFEEAGCTVTRIDDAFAGSVQGTMLTATLTAEATCEEGVGEFDIAWRIEGTRQGGGAGS